LCALLTLCLAGGWTYGQEQLGGLPFIRNFSSGDFKGGIQSWGITQDSRDFIYVANNFGLLEYDGKEWNVYPVKNGTKVRSVYVGRDNRVYVGSQSGFGYFRSNRQGLPEYVALSDSLPARHRNFTEVWRIYGQGDNVYFLTFENIYRYDGRRLTTLVPDGPLEFSFYVAGKIYSQEWGKGLSELKKDRLQLLAGGDFFKHIRIVSILPYGSGLLVLTNSEGMYRFENGRISRFECTLAGRPEKLLINTAALLRDGTIAIGTPNEGLLIVDERGTLKRHISKKDGLLDRSVLHIYQDNQDHVWLALNNGIAMIELTSPFTVIDEKMGLPGAGYAATKGNGVLLGTNNGLFAFDPASRQIVPVPHSTGQVYSIRKAGGDYLVGHHEGPMVLKDGVLSRLSDEKGAWLFKPVPGNEKYFVAGTYAGINLFAKNGSAYAFVRKFDAFRESSRVLEFDKDGNLWMAHGYKGVYKLQMSEGLDGFARVSFYNSKNGFPSDVLINLERINNTLIFPAQRGIYRYDKATDAFVVDDTFSRLFNPDEHVIDMEQDAMGNIYFISDQRVGVLQPKPPGKYALKTDVFQRITDLINDDLTSVQVLDSKNILFGAKEGFIHYNADQPAAPGPFKVHIRKITNSASRETLFGGNPTPEAAALTIPYARNALNFSYSATFFEKPEKTVFQYCLQGFDQNWSEWTPRTDKEYTNLPEGEYTFQVRARNMYGTGSQAANYRFTVLPPWYRTGWAFLLYGMSAVSGLGLIFYTLDRRYKKERKRLVLNKQREIYRKETEIRHLSDKSEQEIIRLKNEKLEAELAHINQELTSSTIHLISKNEQLGSVKELLEGLLQSRHDAPKTEIKRIISEIDKSLSSDADWHKFERNFNLVHGDFIKRLLARYPSLTPQEVKLSAYLRLNLNTKEIAQLMNISIRGVEISRYRLRKKLNLERNENLTEFVLKF
jgi:DNA-binding CsgD family transcriptional regulator